MSVDKIVAELRTEFGKGAARRYRREAKLPAVVYEHGNVPTHILLPAHATTMALRNLGANALLDLDIDGTTQLALTKAVQVDPIRRVIEHIDFVAVKKGEKVIVDVHIVLVGEAKRGTLVVQDAPGVQVEAEATNIPESLEVSIEDAEAGTMIHASDVVLPEGTTLLSDPELLLVNITEAQTAAEVEAELEEAEASAGIERVEPEAVTPAGDDSAE